VSLFTGKSTAWAISAVLAMIVVMALALRLWVAAAPSGRRPVAAPILLLGLVLFVLLHQLISALTLRHFAGLIPVECSDS